MLVKMKQVLLVLGFIKDNTTLTRTGIANSLDGGMIRDGGGARQFAAHMVGDMTEGNTEIVLLTYTIIDTKTSTAIVGVGGGGFAAGADGAAIIIHTRIPVLDRVMAIIGISSDMLPVTGTRAHRRRVHHRLVRVLALLKFPSLKNP